MNLFSVCGEVISWWYGGTRNGKDCNILKLQSEITVTRNRVPDNTPTLYEIIVPLDLLKEIEINIGDQIYVTGKLENIKLGTVKIEVSIFASKLKIIKKASEISEELEEQRSSIGKFFSVSIKTIKYPKAKNEFYISEELIKDGDNVSINSHIFDKEYAEKLSKLLKENIENIPSYLGVFSFKPNRVKENLKETLKEISHEIE